MSLTLQDVAFVGNLVVVAASGPNGSAVCVYDGEKQRLVSGPTAFGDRKIVRLGTSPTDAENVYALAKGQGLFRLNARAAAAGAFEAFIHKFNATGDMEMGFGVAGGFAIATSSSGQTESDVYDQIELIDLQGQESRTVALRDQSGAVAQGSDGAALLLPPGRGRAKAAPARAVPTTGFSCCREPRQAYAAHPARILSAALRWQRFRFRPTAVFRWPHPLRFHAGGDAGTLSVGKNRPRPINTPSPSASSTTSQG
jgi:hypothetical protein